MVCCSCLANSSRKECILCHRKGETMSSKPVSNGNMTFVFSLRVSRHCHNNIMGR
jgi:hypothetical protein